MRTDEQGTETARVCAVIVTHRPDWDALALGVETIRKQVAAIVIVDNGSPGALDVARVKITQSVSAWIDLAENRGIGCAQNAGARWAMANGATHIALFDQDSVPGLGMIERMVGAAYHLAARGVDFAALAPVYVDPRQAAQASFFRIRTLSMERFGCGGGDRLVPTDAAIASGTLIPVPMLHRIGLMREDLFIDLVDVEWYLRARSMGYQAYGVCDATLHHRLGDKAIKVFGRTRAVHDPIRQYYFFRNAVWMMKQQYVPLGWKTAVVFQLARRLFVYALFVPPKLTYLEMIARGGWDGFRSVLGRLSISDS
ncbi:MAG: glycosyltransferase family 2 protein [Thiohalocapsa sp.]